MRTRQWKQIKILRDDHIGDTIASPEAPEALARIHVGEPTVKMTFGVNTSPFGGREGRYCTSRQLRERLYHELETNIGLKVEDTEAPDVFMISGRGELHLSILVETMRREGLYAVTEEYLSLMRRHLGDNLQLLLYVLSGDPVAGQLLILDRPNQTAYIDRIAYSRERNIRSSVVSMWFKICEWAQENGIRYINFGGGWAESGYRLKRKFGGDLQENRLFIVRSPSRLYSVGAGLLKRVRKTRKSKPPEIAVADETPTS
jgi:hypothetical protein